VPTEVLNTFERDDPGVVRIAELKGPVARGVLLEGPHSEA
jgi:hypothetical protein